MTPVRVIYKYKHILPIKLYIPTWQMLPWQTIRTTIELLTLCAKQYKQKDIDI